MKVLDAMSARGIPFRALFILGLNEKVFPRAISEEPFMRDHIRRRLSEVLGNLIPEKLRGFEEERLLFLLPVECRTGTALSPFTNVRMKQENRKFSHITLWIYYKRLKTYQQPCMVTTKRPLSLPFAREGERIVDYPLQFPLRKGKRKGY